MLNSLIAIASPSMLSIYLLHGCGADFVFLKAGIGMLSSPWLSTAVVVVVAFVICLLTDCIRRIVLTLVCFHIGK